MDRSGLELQNDHSRKSAIEEQRLDGSVLRTSLIRGFYTFREQVLEAGTARERSNLAEAYFSITSLLPPIITLPFNGADVSQGLSKYPTLGQIRPVRRRFIILKDQ